MLFNSIEFLFFFVIVLIAYRRLKHRGQNLLLLIASNIFYGWWDWRFLGLIWTSITIDYFCGLALDAENDSKKRRKYLSVSVITNLGILCIFKYFNFFAESFVAAAQSFGWNPHPITSHLILPVGISFYTFQTMSYSIDVYRREVRPAKNILDLALYVSFFPQLVAGPIERASHLLPQILNTRAVTKQQRHEGICLIVWGLYKKIFIADNLSKIVDSVFMNAGTASGGEALIAVYAFAFQIYCDFSGYSDMARGLARLFGIDIMVNFKLPYFVTNPRDFWRHWHISLSTWLRDYLYIPLGGRGKNTLELYRNLMLTMLLGGLWHGASWTFVLWGGYHGILLIAHRIMEPVFQKYCAFKTKTAGMAWRIFCMIVMFHLTCLGWLIFRSDSIGQFKTLLYKICFDFVIAAGQGLGWIIPVVQTVWFLLAVQWLEDRNKNNIETLLPRIPVFVRSLGYLVIFYSLTWYGAIGGKEFIYFQF